MKRKLALGFIRLAAALLFLARGAFADGPALVLEVPVDCDIGARCVVQNYVDHAPGPETRDHTCGPLTYDRHKGIDIRVAGRPEMEAGVPVVAAAPGVVRSVRDGMADISVKETGPEAIKGREAGNAVVIVHDGGWETQYSHMRRGSVAVEKGQRVEAGAALGLIGLSGSTEFPHLEFSVRHGGKTIDPFTGGAPEDACDAAKAPLWSDAARAALAYRAGGLLIAGFAARVPTLKGLLSGEHRSAELGTEAPALVFWAVSWGLRKNDKESIRVTGPDGRVFTEAASSLPKDKAQWMRFTGRKRTAKPWPPGRYRGEYRVTRDGGATIVEATREIEVR